MYSKVKWFQFKNIGNLEWTRCRKEFGVKKKKKEDILNVVIRQWENNHGKL
jgi:hypothetical protein